MPKINKVVTTVWYNKQNMHDLRRVFPDSEFVYVDFYDKGRLGEEVRDADVQAILLPAFRCRFLPAFLQRIKRLRAI